MKIFFERTETNEKIVVVFRPYSMYLLLFVLIGLMLVTFVPALADYEHFGSVLMPIAAVVVLARIVVMYKVNQEIQQAIRNKKVVISGGKLSAKDPLTFVIIKEDEITGEKDKLAAQETGDQL